MSRMLLQLFQDDRGQDLVEYALLAAFIATASIAALTLLGQSVEKLFLQVDAVL